MPAPPADVVIGIGDDAAVLARDGRRLTVVTADSLVEDVHFSRAWSSAESIGHKALAVNLSDLAAMGAEPRAFLLSLVLPAELTVADFDGLLDGALALAAATRATLIGGNLSRSPGPLVIDVTAIGRAKPRKFLTRSGGRPGDDVFVTGVIGRAATGLAMLAAGVDRATLGAAEAECVEAFERPSPRLRQGIIVARTRTATACIDLSDGLAEAARQLAEASGTGVDINAAALPIHPATLARAEAAALDGGTLTLVGGEDYELLFAVPAKRHRSFFAAIRRAGPIPVTHIGRLTKAPGARLVGGPEAIRLPSGYGHFK